MNIRLFLLLGLFLATTIARAGELQALSPGPGALDAHLGKGKWLIVMVWASDCAICNREAHLYEQFHVFHQDEDAKILGISLDGADQAAALGFIAKHEITFPNLITDAAAGGKWFESETGQNFRGTPGFLIYDPAGKIRAQQIGAVPTELIENFIASNSAAE